MYCLGNTPFAFSSLLQAFSCAERVLEVKSAAEPALPPPYRARETGRSASLPGRRLLKPRPAAPEPAPPGSGRRGVEAPHDHPELSSGYRPCRATTSESRDNPPLPAHHDKSPLARLLFEPKRKTGWASTPRPRAILRPHRSRGTIPQRSPPADHLLL